MSQTSTDSDLRNHLRTQLLGNKQEIKTKEIDLFGVTIELRQPSFRDILAMRDDQDEKTRSVSMIVKYVYVPGTDLLVFESTDVDTILNWPFGDDLVKLQEAISELTGLDPEEITATEEQLTADPLGEP